MPSKAKGFFCIYTGKRFSDEARSAEHIVPFSLGGSDDFVTYDVSKEGNNLAGSTADSLLINNFVMVFHRWRRKIASAKGTIPSLVFNGEVTLDTERPARLTVPPTGEPELWVPPQVVWDGDTATIACAEDQFEGIVRNIERKRGKVDAITEAPVAFNTPRMSAEFSIADDQLCSGVVKMAISFGHYVLGYRWSAGSDAANLRTVLKTLARGRKVDWSALRIRGFVWPSTQDENVRRVMSRGEDVHTLAVLNTDPLVFYCLLFGQFESVVRLQQGTWRGNLPPGDGVVVTIDTRTRTVSRTSFRKFIPDVVDVHG